MSITYITTEGRSLYASILFADEQEEKDDYNDHYNDSTVTKAAKSTAHYKFPLKLKVIISYVKVLQTVS